MDYEVHEPIEPIPFMEQNIIINDAITEYYSNSTAESLEKVMYSIYRCMIEDGHFIIPVDIEEKDGETSYIFKTLMLEDGLMATVGFTTKEDFDKAPESGALSNFIDSILEVVKDNEYYSGIILNPWGESFFLTKEMIGLILGAKDA